MKNKAVLGILTGGSLWGLISVFTASLNQYGFTALDICVYRAGLSALILYIVCKLLNPDILSIRIRDMWYFVGTGMISLCLFNWCYFYTIEHSQASIAVGLLYTSPVFVTLLSAVVFKEKMNARKLLAVGATVLGCLLISGIFNSAYAIDRTVFLIGVASGFFYGLYSIFSRVALRVYSPVTITYFTFLYALVGALVANHSFNSLRIMEEAPVTLLWCIGISVFATIIPYFLYTAALKYVETSKAAVLATIEPLVACLVGIFLFDEPGNIEKMAGMGCIFVSTILLNLPEEKG